MGSRTNVKMKHDIDSLHRIYHSSLVHSTDLQHGALFVRLYLRADLQHCNRSMCESVCMWCNDLNWPFNSNQFGSSTSFARFILNVCILFERVVGQIHSEWRVHTQSNGCECWDACVDNFICKWNHQLSTWHYLIRLPFYRRKNKGLQANNNNEIPIFICMQCLKLAINNIRGKLEIDGMRFNEH